jgi:hypothetical protein
MQNLLAKLAALGLIGGGFAATGDLGWLAARGRRVLDAADVAAPAAAEEPEPAAGAGQGDAIGPAAAVAPPGPIVNPAAPAPASPVAAAPAPAVVMKPPAGGPREIVWANLAAGGRVVVWLASGGTRCLVLDVVDAATGEALVYEAAAVSSEGRPLTTAGPPRRVVVGRAGPGLAVGGMLQLAPAGIAAAGNGGRRLGPIEALTVIE